MTTFALFSHAITAAVAALVTFLMSHKAQLLTLVADVKAIIADVAAVKAAPVTPAVVVPVAPKVTAEYTPSVVVLSDTPATIR